MLSLSLKDKVALITGAAGALGLEIVRAFEQADARVAACDRSLERLRSEMPRISGPGGYMLAEEVDVTNPESFGEFARNVATRFGKIDILVNTVGGYEAGKKLHETSLETYEFMMRLNARSAFVTSHVVLPYMLKNHFGRIINIGSLAALKAQPAASAYSAAKAAVCRLTESMAEEYKNDGITVNAILPSLIDTAANRDAMPGSDFSKWVSPTELAQIIAFLCTDYSRSITGALLPVVGRV